MADEKKVATREENLKKINEELEKLSDEELDQVAGGTYTETAQDSELLHFYGLCKKSYDAKMLGMSYDRQEYIGEISTAWVKAGVVMEANPGGCFGPAKSNKYYINGKEVTRTEAYLHVFKIYGDPMTYLLNKGS